jgi:MoaA/NifB/PqqE/SkfB family radical SAM enzyme
MELTAFPWLESETAQTETVALRNIFLHVARACNLRCAYCYFSASRPLPDEMTTEEFARLWEVTTHGLEINYAKRHRATGR